MAKKGTTEWYMGLVAKTDGFKIEGSDNAVKATNLETGKSLTCHISDFGDAIRQSDITRLRRLGWTLGLYEAQQAAVKRQRSTRSKAVTHRLNAFLESRGLFESPDPPPQREDHVIPSQDAYAHESGETMTVEEIGPELARKYLDTVSIDKDPTTGKRLQRRASAKVIQGYAEKMLRGEWVRTHQTIAFADGHLIDGQQRMAAVEISQTVQSFWVARGFSIDIFPKTDKGKGRTANDTFFAEGEDNAAQLVPVTRYAFLVDHVPDQRNWPTARVSDEQLLGMIQELSDKGHPDPRESLLWAKASRTCKAQGSAIATAHYLIRRENPQYADAVNAWFEQLRWGADLTVGDPLFALRNWLAAAPTRRTMEKNVKNVPKQLLHLYLIIKAWDNTQEGKRIGQVAYQVPVTIPKPVKYRVPVPQVPFVNNKHVNNPPTD